MLVQAVTENAVARLDVPLVDKIARAHAAIERLYAAHRPVCIAWSGGKDSTIVLALAFEAALARRAGGGNLPPIMITHANTGIENPAYQLVIEAELAKIRHYIAKHDLPARVDVALPALNDSWSVTVISGRVLPTFARSANRQCSIMLKVVPQTRQRQRALATLATSGEPVVLIGTRFEESATRAQRMTGRGESDVNVWTARAENGSNEARLSPIARWDDEDVWTYLSQLRSGEHENYTDVRAIWDAYAAGGGGGSCAVVGDEGLKASAKACGARFGCALCTAVGRDKSLEGMIESDRAYDYLRGLNRLQRYLIHTQADWTRRNWLGRTIDDEGFIAIAPDTYAPAMQRELLAICLSLQEDERRAAARLGIAPRFTLVTSAQLLAIDALWSAQAHHPKPFEAIAIWHRIVMEGVRQYAPVVEGEAPITPIPKPRYLYVGNWDDNPGAEPLVTSPLCDVAAILGGVHERRDQAVERERLAIQSEAASGRRVPARDTKRRLDEAARTAGGCLGVRHLASGALVMDVRESPRFEIDEEGAEDFLAFLADECLQERRGERASPLDAYRYYCQLGVLATTPQHLASMDEILRRSAWKVRHDLHRKTSTELLALSVGAEERKAGLKAPAGERTLFDRHQDSPTMQRFRRYQAILEQGARPAPKRSTVDAMQLELAF